MSRLILVFVVLMCFGAQNMAQTTDTTVLTVIRTDDFEPGGKGDSPEWAKAAWTNLTPRKNSGHGLQTKVKTMYSGKGMYFLFYCEDVKITSTMNADFLDLWKEDVVEVFIQTEKGSTSYFEYEVSPKNFELPILISNVNGDLARWLPFHYESGRKTKHKTHIEKIGTDRVNWTAEFFVPYELLRPLNNYIPTSGTKWYGNFYRIDTDDKKYTSWTWQLTENSFHDIKKFGTFLFE